MVVNHWPKGRFFGYSPFNFLDGNNNISVKPYFGDILLVPGPGPMEKKSTQPFLSLWRKFLFRLADKFGFKSSKAKGGIGFRLLIS